MNFLCFAVGDEALHLSQSNIFFFRLLFSFHYLFAALAGRQLSACVCYFGCLVIFCCRPSSFFSSSLICMVGGVGKLEQLFLRYDTILL